ncbi:MAG: nickel pincer cofactor biosynthesis protein LarB [Chloroflexota bacterium]|nr:nickel pincer cofactor biosynthesis protein LarB [Chloroflexota bacterium]
MSRSNSADLHEASFARPDYERERRKGVPEIVLTDTKTVSQSLAIAASLLEGNGRAILSRVSPDLRRALEEEYGSEGFEWYPASRMAVVHAEGFEVPASGGHVGIISAGTSDQPAAQEAAIVCREMGCDVHVVHDVGVAGLHRLFGPLERLLDEENVDVIIVAAGMDGALPSVVSGLVDVPVLGLPTSVGYGMGGGGEAALLAMLQTCSPGLAVVNIDNGVGAGVMAALIADRVASARSGVGRKSREGGQK